MNQFEKGEKLNETLTIGKIEEVNTAFTTIDQYIVNFNAKIRTIKNIINTGEITHIDPIEKPELIVLPDEYLDQIAQINKNIETINKFAGQNINNLPETLQKPIKEALKEVEKEINNIDELKPFTEVILPETEFSFIQESSYNFGFSQYIEGEKNIRIDSILITTANIDFEIIPSDKILEFINKLNPAILIIDFNPIINRGWMKGLACKIYEIDGHNIIPARFVSDKQEYSASTLRSKIYRNIYPTFYIFLIIW